MKTYGERKTTKTTTTTTDLSVLIRLYVVIYEDEIVIHED